MNYTNLPLGEAMDQYQRAMLLSDAACATVAGMTLKRWHEIKYEGHRPQAGEYAQVAFGLSIAAFSAAALSICPTGHWRAY